MSGDWLLEIFKYLWGALVPYLVYLHKRVDKVAESQNEKISRDEFTETIKSIRSHIDEGNRQVTDRIDKLMQLLLERQR